MTLFDYSDQNNGNSRIYNEALKRGMDAANVERWYRFYVEKVHIPYYIAKQVALKEMFIPYKRLKVIGRIFGHWNKEWPEEKQWK